MTAPGWYHAEGDPVGTQRYWDGVQWVGEPAYEPAPLADATPGPTMYPPQTAAQPASPYSPPAYPPPAAIGPAYQASPPSKYHASVKPLAIILTVLKAIPLGFGLFFVVIFGAVLGAIDDDELGTVSDDADTFIAGLIGAAVAILAVFILIGALLIGFQLAGAMTERPLMLFIPALLMTVFDALVTWGTWSELSDSRNSSFGDDSAGWPILMTIVFVLQGIVAFQAARAMRTT